MGTRMGLVGLAMATAALGGVAAGCGSSSHASVAKLLDTGAQASTDGNYATAAADFRQAIKQSPTNATAHYDLGTVYQAQHLDQPALTEYRTALKYQPNMVSALYNEAVIVAATDAPLAIFLYQRVIQLQPQSPTALLNLGLLLDARGQKPQAGVDLRRAVAAEPDLRSRIPSGVLPDLFLKPPAQPRQSPATVPGAP